MRPPVEAPPAVFKAAVDESGVAWTPASPADAAVKGDWWTDFGDPALNALEAPVDVSSQTVHQAAAQF